MPFLSRGRPSEPVRNRSNDRAETRRLPGPIPGDGPPPYDAWGQPADPWGPPPYEQGDPYAEPRDRDGRWRRRDARELRRRVRDRYDDGRPGRDDGRWREPQRESRREPQREAPREPEKRRRPSLRPPKGAFRRIGKLLLLVLVIQAVLIVTLRFVDPPTTAFMLANPQSTVQRSMPVEHVSRNFLAAVIAHEDQQLPYRSGAFDWDALWARAQAHMAGEEDPSGSTIPQQVAKNMFLNQEMSAWRKALEAGLAWEMALAIDDRRMLELYVNYAQFGPALYGVCAASWYYFDTPPSTLSVEQSVQIVGLLPSPGHVRRLPGGGLDYQVEDGLGWLSQSHVINAQNRVPRHIEERGFQPVADAGIEGLAQDQPPSDDDCSSMPDDVAELIAEEGTA